MKLVKVLMCAAMFAGSIAAHAVNKDPNCHNQTGGMLKRKDSKFTEVLNGPKATPSKPTVQPADATA